MSLRSSEKVGLGAPAGAPRAVLEELERGSGRVPGLKKRRSPILTIFRDFSAPLLEAKNRFLDVEIAKKVDPKSELEKHQNFERR